MISLMVDWLRPLTLGDEVREDRGDAELEIFGVVGGKSNLDGDLPKKKSFTLKSHVNEICVV